MLLRALTAWQALDMTKIDPEVLPDAGSVHARASECKAMQHKIY
jgi:hypothetical protein